MITTIANLQHRIADYVCLECFSDFYKYPCADHFPSIQSEIKTVENLIGIIVPDDFNAFGNLSVRFPMVRTEMAKASFLGPDNDVYQGEYVVLVYLNGNNS